MNRKYWLILAAAAVVYVIFHLATLIYSPFPWFDEVSFASITDSYMQHHTFYEMPRILAVPEQKLNYGPIYFMWQSMVMRMFGFGIFSFRISNMLFGFIDLLLIYQICRRLKLGTSATVTALLLIALEPNFNQFLHSGRMDYMSMFFLLLSYLSFDGINAARKYTAPLFGLATGLLLACAMLTTPRIVFAFVIYVAFFLYEIITNKDNSRLFVLLKYVYIAAGFGALYYLWMYLTFGGLAGYIYTTTHAAYMKEHIGVGDAIVIRYNLFIYIFAFVAFLVLVRNKILAPNAKLVLLTLPAIAVFIAIVTGGISGRYFALVLPFLMLLIAGVFADRYPNKWLRYTTYSMAAAFAAVFVFKAVYIMATIPQRDPVANERVISKYIEPNTSVAAEFQYYYIARHNNCSFLSLDDNGSLDGLIKYILENKIRYIIIRSNRNAADLLQPGGLKEKYMLVGHVDENKNYSRFFGSLLKKIPYNISDSYACDIYRRKE